MRAYAAKGGVARERRRDHAEIADGILTATRRRTASRDPQHVARGHEIAVTGRGQLRYITELDGQQITGKLPVHRRLVQPLEVLKFEFLEPGHPVSALRPADPLEVTWGFYSPNASFAYPGGQEPLSA